MTFAVLASDLLDAWHGGFRPGVLDRLSDRAAAASETWTQAQRVAWGALMAAAREAD